MRKRILHNHFLEENIYLPVASLLLFSISVFTGMINSDNGARSYGHVQQAYISKAEKNFETLAADTAMLKSLAGAKQTEAVNDKITSEKQLLFIYGNDNLSAPLFWSSQTVLPDSGILGSRQNEGLEKLSNAYYFFQKKNVAELVVISLLPVKWDYFISNDYLENTFAIHAADGKRFTLSDQQNESAVSTKDGLFLFSLKDAETPHVPGEGLFTAWLRIIALLPLLLFIHFTASYLNTKRGLRVAALFLSVVLVSLRVLSYFFIFPHSLRQFGLFDPAVYGAGIVHRSLGDLLINAVIFLWIINFIKNRLGVDGGLGTIKPSWKWPGMAVAVPLILVATFGAGAIIRSLVADSQISFDVINFFSMDVYSVIGFLVLCCIAIGYYYFCRVLFFFLQRLFPGFILPVFIAVAAGGLLLLSFRVGHLNDGFELYELVWLLVFLLLIRTDLAGFFLKEFIISRLVFWLFFFSASITSVIIRENSDKELLNRRHYAELIAAKTDPAAEAMLSAMLTGFRPGMLAQHFNELTGEKTAALFRDSLVNNGFSGYTDKYDTKVLVYDSSGRALYNQEAVPFNTINTVLSTQARRASVEGLFYIESAFDKLSYLAKRTIRDAGGVLMGYAFIMITPRNFENSMLYPALFSRDDNMSIENSATYAYAIYDRGKLVSAHNEYPFNAVYPEKYFAGREFFLSTHGHYTELWYNAGNEKFVVIVKEQNIFIESITLFSYLFCAFLLLSAFSRLLSLLLRSRFRVRRLKSELQFTIRRQVHGTIIVFSALSFIIIGIATILFFVSNYEDSSRETLSRTGHNIEQELRESLSKTAVDNTVFQTLESSLPGETANLVNRLAALYGPDVNLYSISGDLRASSFPLPYIKGIVSRKMDPRAFFMLNTKKDISYFQKEHIGALEFMSDYLRVTDDEGNDIAYLNIPYFTSQSKLREEISGFLVTIINLNAFIFLIAGIAALIITNRITASFSYISEKMRLTDLGAGNHPIEWRRNDEIGALVKEYNRMLSKLDESAASLARTEREHAWQEMAQQVAHEIKNPLTPMKLSMQFLQRSIENDSPGIKELSAKVSATLIEQIDHLNRIAGEFSRFANIEKAEPDLFDLTATLESAKQLYAGDIVTKFSWDLLPLAVMIRADKTHVNRILTNLILNGIQAVPEGRQAVIAVSEKISDDNVIISISDNGSGINDAARQKIFTPNFTTKSSGTGLGLAMCKRMAEQAGGDITYTTSLIETVGREQAGVVPEGTNHGTTFFVRLPLAK